MQEVQPAQYSEKVQITERITLEKIKELGTESIKHYLYGKTIKMGTMNYEMLLELKKRHVDIAKYKVEK